MPSFQFGTTTIEYSLHLIEGKNDVSISVEWLDGIQVIAPSSIEDAQLDTIIRKKAPWILDKWDSFNQIHNPTLPREFLSGEKIPYLGRNYRLKVNKEDVNSAQLMFHQGKFILTIPNDISDEQRVQLAKDTFKEWYIQHGKQKINERLDIYSAKLNLYPKRVIIKDQKTRWGSCTSNGDIILNWRIIMAPVSILDYLLVHELVHLEYRNHSTDYWNLVRSVFPDFEARKKWLRLNGPSLTL